MINKDKKVFIVQHHMGVDGDHIITLFSNEKDAIMLCDMYNNTSASDEYDFYSYYSYGVDEIPIKEFKMITDDDGDTWLEW